MLICCLLVFSVCAKIIITPPGQFHEFHLGAQDTSNNNIFIPKNNTVWLPPNITKNLSLTVVNTENLYE